MKDSEMWEKAVAAVVREFAALPHPSRAWVGERAAAIREHKIALNALSQGASGGEICAVCRGACCVRGRHHFTVIDLLVHLAAGRPLPAPNFTEDLCPWLGPAGCLIAPDYRPFNCVTFNCEQVEGRLDRAARERFYRIEGELRAVYGEVEEFFGNRFMQGLLLNYERAEADGGDLLVGGKRVHDAA